MTDSKLTRMIACMEHIDQHIDHNTAYEISREFRVSEEVLFGSFINEAILKTLWGVSSITVDARPGGKARATLEIDDEDWSFTLTYQEVVPNSRLRWNIHFDRFPTKEIRVTLFFETTPNAAKVTVRMENFETSQERDGNKAAWESALDRLEVLLGEHS